MRRRSRSDAPPHTPCSMRFSSAYSRHSARTGQVLQTTCAASTPSPSEGKKSAGFTPRHLPCNIQAYSSGVSCTVISLQTVPTGLEFPWFSYFLPPQCCPSLALRLGWNHVCSLNVSNFDENSTRRIDEPGPPEPAVRRRAP